MSKITALLFLILVATPVIGVHSTNYFPRGEKTVNDSSSDIKDLKVQFLKTESPAWRISLVFTVLSFIPDDRVRAQFLTRRDVIKKYASDPSNWGNPSDHLAEENLAGAIWMNYVMFVDALQREDYRDAAKYVGILGHYMGDASDPMNVDAFTNTSLKYAEVYESILDNSSVSIFAVYGYAYTPSSKVSVSVNRSVNELIHYTKQFVDTVKGYIDEGDYEALSLTAAEIAEKAVNTFLSVILKAMQDSGLTNPWRVLARWGDVIFAVMIAGIGVMFLFIVRNLKKRTVPEGSVEEEAI